MKTKCLEVSVRFNSPNHQGVTTSFRNGDTRVHYLVVENNGHTLTIKHCDREGASLQELNYNYTHVLEYHCTGWVQE